VQRLAHEAPPGKVVFGTDWPFYHQAVGIAKVLIATEGEPDLRAAVLRENAARLLGLPG
jgi:predicted TIM-barrel fold metal-dependent hydrolase